MVFPAENIPAINSEKTQHLKPYLPSSSIDGSEAPQNHSAPSPPPDLKTLSFSVSFNGWRFANIKFKSWARKMAALHEPIWRKAGIFEAVMASTYKIHKNTDLVLGIAEKWCPDTNTFVFSWGETTITLEDVMILLGFSVLGSPVFASLDSSGQKIMTKLEKEWLKLKENRVWFVTQVLWIDRFMDSGDELEHVAFLVLWLSYFVLPSQVYHIDGSILPIAVHLSIGTKIALAPAVLAHLYAELSLLKNHIKAFSESPIKVVKLYLTALFKLVLVWTWERFKEIQPKPNPMLKGEPRLARWSDLKQRINGAREILDKSKIDSFEWRPYTKKLKNWDFPKFYPEKAIWVSVGSNLDDDFISFARCIKVSELVGIESVELYFPNRVASQFGMLQDVHCLVNRNKLSKEAAWNDYNKPIDDLTLYIPCLAQDLLRFDHYDEDSGYIDASLNILPFGKGFPAKRRRSMIRRSVSRDKVGELEKSLLSSGWKMKKTSEDWTNKFASIKIEQRGEEDDETGSKAQKKRRICDDFEVDGNGNTAEKSTMIDDNGNGTVKAECLVHEDGEKKKCNERLYSEVKKEEEIDERLKQRKFAIKKIQEKLEASIVKVEKTLAKIRNRKSRGKQIKTGGVSA